MSTDQSGQRIGRVPIEVASSGVAARPSRYVLVASGLLQPYSAGGVLTKQGTFADVPTKHRRALVTRLLSDDALGDSSRGSRGRKTGPQRVTGYLAGRARPGRRGASIRAPPHYR